VPSPARGCRLDGRASRDVPVPSDVAARRACVDAHPQRRGRAPACARGGRRRRGGGAQVRLALAGSVVFVLACLFVPQGLRSTALYSDVHVYHAYAHNMTSGEVPYRDFFDEYPPLAQPIILAAHSVLLFKLLLTLCGVGIVWLLATVFRSGAAVAVFALSLLLVGSIYLNAYDLW